MSRWRGSSGTRSSGACRCGSRPPCWCRGRRPRPWSKPPSRRWHGPASAPRGAHRRSRHRLGRDPAGAAVRAAAMRRVSAPTATRRALAVARRNAEHLGLAGARRLRRLRFRRGARRVLRSRGVQSALYREPATSRRWRRRCATSIRGRALDGGSDGLDGLSGDRGGRPPAARARADGWWSRSGSARPTPWPRCWPAAGWQPAEAPRRDLVRRAARGYRPGTTHDLANNPLPPKPSKNHLDYAARPTTFRSRNRPEFFVRRP